MVESIIRHTKKSPILWVTHQRLTKSKNVIGEQLVDVEIPTENSAFVRFQKSLLVKFLEFKPLRKFMKNWFGIIENPNLRTKL